MTPKIIREITREIIVVAFFVGLVTLMIYYVFGLAVSIAVFRQVMPVDTPLGLIERLLGVLLAVPIYLLPTFVAQGRHHRKRKVIMLLNIFLGWTVMGWVVALLWSATADVEKARHEEDYRRI